MDTLKSIKEVYNDLMSFFTDFGKAFRSRNSLKFFTALLTVVLVFNPFFLNALLEQLGKKTLPSWYFTAEIVIAGILFIVCAAIAVNYKEPITKDHVPLDRTSIKGLVLFVFNDAKIFQRLERREELRSLRDLITGSDFYLVVLVGRSGCGKTSFLRAGIHPLFKKPF